MKVLGKFPIKVKVFKVGDKVFANGFRGVVTGIYDKPFIDEDGNVSLGMYDVRLPGGEASICGFDVHERRDDLPVKR